MLPTPANSGMKPTRNRPSPWKRACYVGLGALMSAFGLEMFLTPNKIIAGGVHGISSLLSHVTEMQMGLILFFLNLPYVLYSSRTVNRTKALLIVFGFLLLSGITIALHPFPPFVEDPPLAALLGGALLGTGAGLVLFYAGPLDGLHHAAFMLKKRIPLSIDEIFMIINLALLGLAGFIFGWDQAVYSVVTYTVAMIMSKRTVNRLYRYKAIWIRTRTPQTVKEALLHTPGIDFYVPPFLSNHQEELYLTIPKAQEKFIIAVVSQIDPDASLSMTPVHGFPDYDAG